MRVLVFGNSGSGKSTFARQFSARHNLKVLDLDHVVWSRTKCATFRPDEEIIRELDAFVAANLSWVVEGCYGRWMEHLQSRCTEMVFLNPGEAACLANCQTRPWEPEKYPSQAEQDAKLPFLLDWVRGYYSRTDDLSLSAHRRLFESFNGAKQELSRAVRIVAQFRDALPDEVGALEELQRRTAMVSNYREQILAHPDAIEISLKAVVDRNARVALVDGRVLGFSIVLPLADGLAELDGLFVEPEFMGRGLGRALLEDAFSIGRDHGVRRIEVTSNLEAVGFYERIGFIADGPAATRFGPAVRMHIEIGAINCPGTTP